jgi:hypothetical protein
MDFLLPTFFGCGFPVLMIYVAVRTVGWVLGPLDRAAKNRDYPIQFSIADFLCLFVEVQLALSGPALLFRRIESREMSFAIAVALFTTALAILVWWSGVRTLSRAGVHGTFARAVTLTIVMPFGFVSSIASAIIPFGILVSLGGAGKDLTVAGIFMLIEIPMVLVVVGLGLITRRIAATAERQHTPRDGQTSDSHIPRATESLQCPEQQETPDTRSRDDGSIKAPYGSYNDV